MDRLTTMTTFLKVVKCANFTTAAEDLGISRTLVSRHVADLEAHLGVKLLNRTTRLVSPTEEGLRYAELSERVLNDIRLGEEQMSSVKNEVEGVISILCPIWIGSFGISAATSEFCKLYPKISITIAFEEPSANPHEFLSMGHDVCIQPNTLRDSSIMVKKLGKIEHLLVASPGYIEEHGMPETVVDLGRHQCLAKIHDGHWTFSSGEKLTLKLPSRLSSNSVFALREACLSGLGISMLPKGIMRESLAQGDLIEVLPKSPIAPRPLYVAFPPGGDAPRRTRTLISFLADWFKQHNVSN